MKVGICSDIHVHRHDQANEVQELIAHVNGHRDLDLLICAGDLSHHTEEVRSFLQSITLDCPRAWLPGNHDLWVIDAESESDTSDSRYRVMLPAPSDAAGWHYLPSGPLRTPGGRIAVVGTTGWFTDRGYSEWFDADADERDQELATRFASELEQNIASVDGDARLIVVTHHVPHPGCLPEGDPRNGEHSIRIAEVIAVRRPHRVGGARPQASPLRTEDDRRRAICRAPVRIPAATRRSGGRDPRRRGGRVGCVPANWSAAC